MNTPLAPGEFPPNPLEKPGYQLEFHDEFDGGTLDQRKWLPVYLPQWSSRARSAPRYALRDSTLALQITHDHAPWCPEFDGTNRCSSVQTGVFAGPLGSHIGQHRFNPACTVREEQATARTYTPQYGYFELRARGPRDPRCLFALWMIGFEDVPERSGEIAILEIKGTNMTPSTARNGHGVHPWSDPQLSDDFAETELPIDATQFHIYAAEWRPDRVDFYVDNWLVRTVRQSPAYPMQFMLDIYELPVDAQSERFRPPAAYPKEFVIDYFRAYQPLGGYRQE